MPPGVRRAVEAGTRHTRLWTVTRQAAEPSADDEDDEEDVFPEDFPDSEDAGTDAEEPLRESVR